MKKRKGAGGAAWKDPDQAPELTEEWFAKAKPHLAGKPVAWDEWKHAADKVGRPRVENPKKQVSLRIDADVIEQFRATGPGWQTRINAALRRAIRSRRKQA